MPNIINNNCFTAFTSEINQLILPSAFTYPFCYQPHPLALKASEELQKKLADFHPIDSKKQGRMYGVLVVKNLQGTLGYLSAFSGNSNKADIGINFVPVVFDVTQSIDFVSVKQDEIKQINHEILTREASPSLKSIEEILRHIVSQSEVEISQLQWQMRENKKARKEKRVWLSQADLVQDDIKQISINLSRESVTDKKALLTLKGDFNTKISRARCQVNELTDEIAALKKATKKLAVQLQKHICQQYQFLNTQGAIKDLSALFKETIEQKPPVGSGDCAAPKLLQCAFSQQLTPICMAEFWWGEQPKSEIRKHKYYYPVSQGKCQPILAHMLSGMTLDENPLLKNPAEGKLLEIVFQDEHVVVVNKPAGLLSVPGKSIKDSVYTRIKEQFPKATGSLIVHRLDMATSGLLMLALNEQAHKHLQQQFINKQVSKRYVATIEGCLAEKSGKICLPLRGDFHDRPKQLVCYEQGKYAETTWQVIEEKSGKTKLFLYPITGRTHQLRMHCAHPYGLNIAIVGDSLYGTNAGRLHLHAQRLSFTHPINKQLLVFEVDEEF